MYIALLLFLIILGVFTALQGLRTSRKIVTLLGACLLAATGLLFGGLSFWTDVLWFEAVGYSQRFWTVILTQAAMAAGGALFGVAVVWTLTLPLRQTSSPVGNWPEFLGGSTGAVWGFGNWERVLLLLNGGAGGTQEPVFGRDTGFYLFRLPMLDSLFTLLLLLALISLAAVIGDLLYRSSRQTGEDLAEKDDPAIFGPFYKVAAIGLFVMAFGKYLDLYHLMYSEWGVVTGPGWTDVYVRIPAYWAVIAGCTLFGALFLAPPARERMHRAFAALPIVDRPSRNLAALAMPFALIGGLWILALGAAPALSQWLRVQPNEITLERDYIANNIEFTRLGFDLDDIEERQFAASEALTQSIADANEDLLSEVRLWDPRALDAVYEQFQEIRLYYEFTDVDIDRYHVGDRYRQVMVAARDMNQSNLPESSQTFVNKRFKYTHGNGITLAPVSDFTPEGLPNLLVKDIPPQASHPSLQVTRPELYYAQLTQQPVVANSTEPELSHPSGEENVYSHYKGNGGVELSSFWRKVAYGWKFDGTRFLLSSYPTEESRILYRRNIRERVQTIAPFLEVDTDPYIVLAEGQLYWIVDAYTTSKYFPYSETYTARELIEYSQGERKRVLSNVAAENLSGANYVRNSVKAVVNAHDGAVALYVFESEDPLVQAWSKAFPGMFQPEEEMPDELREHVRYPHPFLLLQGLVYAKYHMTDPVVFYNQEDLWVRATEKYYAQVQPVEPYYIMWKRPGEPEPEFVAILPFTPKNRQVLIGWIAGMCDGDQYGRLLAYKFPKEKRVPGPQQVETKIDQDPYLSGQLSLWDQRGSRVIRGNVLAIPLNDTLLYVEPIYLQAETAAYPELRLVVTMHNDNLSYGETFEESLRGLLEGGPPPGMVPTEQPGISGVPITDLVDEATEKLQSLRDTLNEMREIVESEEGS